MAVMVTQAQKPKWGALIKARREALGESQTVFGKRFGVTHAAVSYWEADLKDPPGKVTWWIMQTEPVK